MTMLRTTTCHGPGLDVCPIRIGAQHKPQKAIVLIYTIGEESNDIRKRVMPLRRLGVLGVDGATRKMIEAHKEYLGPEKICHDQIAKVVSQLVDTVAAVFPKENSITRDLIVI